MSKFRIGQKVVAIMDHHQGFFKKGQIFTVKIWTLCHCGCENPVINIGVNTGYYYTRCSISGIDKLPPNFFLAKRFRLIEEILREQSEADLSRIEKEINEQIPVEV